MTREITLTQYAVITLPSGDPRDYTIADLLNESVWGNGHWSEDEATAAAFDRLSQETVAAIHEKRKAHWIEGDHGHVMQILRAMNFQGRNAIALSHLRNIIALAPRCKAKEERAQVAGSAE